MKSLKSLLLVLVLSLAVLAGCKVNVNDTSDTMMDDTAPADTMMEDSAADDTMMEDDSAMMDDTAADDTMMDDGTTTEE